MQSGLRNCDHTDLLLGRVVFVHFETQFSAANSKTCFGFTLIEMLVVMTLIALLMTLALPRYFGSLDRSRETALRENLKVMRVTIDKFYSDKGRFPDGLQELVDEKYLMVVPIDPITETDRTWIPLPSQDVEKKGIANVKSGAPGKDSSGRGFESY